MRAQELLEVTKEGENQSVEFKGKESLTDLPP